MSDTAPKSHWVKCLTKNGHIRAVTIDMTRVVREMVKVHQLKGESAVLLGEAAVGAMILASHSKKGEVLNLNVKGSKVMKQAFVDASPDGTVRGYSLLNQGARKADDEKGPWGEGSINVLRVQEGTFDPPYTGVVPLVTGHFAKDLTFYWLQSEQVPSAVGIRVRMDGDQLGIAQGFLVQALPGAEDDELKWVEQSLEELSKDKDWEDQKHEPKVLIAKLFQQTPVTILEDKEIILQCKCSKEKVSRALTMVGVEELKDMLKDEKTLVLCDFCRTEYHVDDKEIQKLIQKVQGA